MAAKGPVKSRSRSVPAPDTNGNTKYRPSAENSRNKRRISTGPIPTRMPKYNKGYHAVLAMIKDLKVRACKPYNPLYLILVYVCLDPRFCLSSMLLHIGDKCDLQF